MTKKLISVAVFIFLFLQMFTISFISFGNGAGACFAASLEYGNGGTTQAQTFSNLSGLMNGLPQTPSAVNMKSQRVKSLLKKYGTPKVKSKKSYKANIVKPPKKIKLSYSKIEKMYRRLYPFGTPLKQFGYNYFINKKIRTTMVGAVGDNYVVGPGDSLNIYVSGSPTEVLGIPNVLGNIKVNREGFINIPYIGTVYVWNKTLGDIKGIINSKFSQRFKNVSVSVSVNKLRQFTVYVSGFVRKPGPILANGTMSVMDALTIAGGISREGSLRNILVRIKTKYGTFVRRVDLYNLLLKGIPVNSYLTGGEVVYVGPIGRTAAVSGSVKRPAIYEIKSDTTYAQLIYNMAGGPQFFSHMKSVKVIKLVKGKYRTLTHSLKSDKFLNKNIKNGEVIVLNNLFYKFSNIKNAVYVSGKVGYPGLYSVKTTPNLKDLIEKIGLLPDTDLNYAQIVSKQIIRFSPEDVLSGAFNIALKTGDRVVFYPEWIINPIEVSGEGIKTPVFVSYSKGMTLLKALGSVHFTISPGNLKTYIFASKSLSGKKHHTRRFNAKRKLVRVVYLHNLLSHQSVKNNPILLPGESILIKKLNPTELVSSVTILGQVSRPGVYRLKKGMSLYDLIIKAGGYTSSAYPNALVFIRRSVKEMQKVELNEAIMNVESNIASVAPVTGIGTAAEQNLAHNSVMAQEKQYIASLKTVGMQGLGRIALNIPDHLRYLKYSRENIKLRSGDFIFVPPKPDFVLVMGAVFNQIAIPYTQGKTVGWYLKQAGGLKGNADAGQTYLIRANGRAVSAAQYGSFWSFIGIGPGFYNMPVNPGDAIAVPPKFQEPILWMPLIKDVTQIIFNSISTVALVRYL